MPRLVVCDFLNIFFRSFHAAPPLTNSKGVPTGGVFVFTKSLLSLLNEFQPTHFVMALDARSFRKDLDPEYKVKRTPLDEAVKTQIKLGQAVLKALPVPSLRVDGFEADDVVATLVARAPAEGFEVTIVSSDKDLQALMAQGATVWDPKNNAPLQLETFTEKWGVQPQQLPDLLSLTGDSVDNIKGVEGVGPKTAAAWLAKHETLDAIIAAAPDKKAFTGKRGDALRAAIADGTLARARQLVALRTDVPVPPLEELRMPPRNEETARRLFEILEFHSLMPSEMPAGPVGVRSAYAPTFDAQGRRIG